MEEIKEAIAELILNQLKHTALKKDDILNIIEIPPSPELGDYAFPCFILAKEMKKSPVDIATGLATEIKPGKAHKDISGIKAAGPYLNFFLDKKIMVEQAINKILKEKEKFGKAKEAKKGKVMVEFCHANTHKAFHIGHTRNISLGESISRILESRGFKVIRANYQGDIGMHVAKTLWGMLNLKKLGLKEPENEKGKWLGIVYAKASQAAKNEKTAEEINKINQELYSGDKKLSDLWKKTRKWSIDYFEKVIYPDFDAKFDRFYFESEVEKEGVKIAKKLLGDKIAKLSEGAIIMDFEKQGLGVFILLKSDGTPLYSTKDLELAELQDKEYKPDRILHIVASEQNLYFSQLIKTIHSYNGKLAEKEEHISYELVILPTGKMASREGNVILYDDTLEEIKGLVKAEITKRDKGINSTELEKRAKKISLGAIKYSMLKQSPNKTIVFNEEEITRFEGDTGPYLQYSYARASSILKKAKISEISIKSIKISSLELHEIELARKLYQLPNVIEGACRQLNPSSIANYSFELARLFSEFYHACPVIHSSKEVQNQRLALVQSFRIVMKNALWLLGIDAIEEM